MTTQPGQATGASKPDMRQDHRTPVSWPVIVQVGNRLFLCQARDVSSRGAKVHPRERLEEGTVAQLHFHPPGKEPLDVPAIVSRSDADGMAFLFIGDRRPRLPLGLPG